MADRVSEASNSRAEHEEEENSSGIRVNGMQFAYDAQPPLFYDFNLRISPGSRCLLVGANGSGNRKTTACLTDLTFLLGLFVFRGDLISRKVRDCISEANCESTDCFCREDYSAEDSSGEANGGRQRCGASVKLFGFS